MKLTIVGPGRAGMSLALAATTAGHEVVAVVGRSAASAHDPASTVGAPAFGLEEPFPPGELMLLAVRDDSIAPVAESLAVRVAPEPGSGAVHLSGLVSRDALRPLAEAGFSTGVFHPLQTMPSPEAGAARLAGAWVGITADDLGDRLADFAASLQMHSFEIADEQKALYHAAAAAAANFPLLSLSMSQDLFAAAGVPFGAARPLVEAIVANAFDLGPRSSLTGPVARGDAGTVIKQLDAVALAEPAWLADFVAMVRSLARISGNGPRFEEMLTAWKRPTEEPE